MLGVSFIQLHGLGVNIHIGVTLLVYHIMLGVKVYIMLVKLLMHLKVLALVDYTVASRPVKRHFLVQPLPQLMLLELLLIHLYGLLRL